MSSEPAHKPGPFPSTHTRVAMFNDANPSSAQPRDARTNYVFVDEHNRHKRLKVVRACEICRKKKIKCDAATTNRWPCSACFRLNLPCVRRNATDEDISTSSLEGSHSDDYIQGSASLLQDHYPRQALETLPQTFQPSFSTPAHYVDSFPPFSQAAVPASHALDHNHNSSLQSPQSYPQYPPPSMPYCPSQDQKSNPLSDSSVGHLTDVLGSLNVDDMGTALYLRNKASFGSEEAPVGEDEENKIPLVMERGHKVRIPPELMPVEAKALRYFDLFFTHVHPYVPVLSKSLFYHQWYTARAKISPLILGALFAIGGKLAEEPAQGQQWLAMATRHTDAFMDTPRISTLQALLLLLKARESVPKRGYFYRSWMSVVQCVQMGKDLGLDEHLAQHQAGRLCEMNQEECQLNTRLWQVVFAVEVMTGAAQGRTDLAVQVESVDFTLPSALPGGGEGEYITSRNFTYFARVVRNVSRMNYIYSRQKHRKDWGMDPEYLQLLPSLNGWLNDLPPDLSINFPPDEMPPWLPSPFAAHLLSYFCLSMILFHRPQIAALDPTTSSGLWKEKMQVCLSSAKLICRLQEALVNSYGLSSLHCVLRGYSYNIYCCLQCIVLHLVCMTSPDPGLNTNASWYFSRHMRIIEKITTVWQMPEMQMQIDAIREAFSVDTSRPFVLKPSFSYGSRPSSNGSSHPGSHATHRSGAAGMGASESPASDSNRLALQSHRQGERPRQDQQPFTVDRASSRAHRPQEPPAGLKIDTSSAAGQCEMSETTKASAMEQATTPPNWNPAQILKQWNMSFGPAPPPPQTPQTPGSNPGAISCTVPPPSSSTQLPTMNVSNPMTPSRHVAPGVALPVPNLGTHPISDRGLNRSAGEPHV